MNDDSSKFLKDKNDEKLNDNKEINDKFLPPRLQMQYEQNNDGTNKVQNSLSTSKYLFIIKKILTDSYIISSRRC